jgi:hypothetical protein
MRRERCRQFVSLCSVYARVGCGVCAGPIGRVPHISPTPPPDAIVIGTEGFVARYTSLGGTSKLEFWDSRQGTGTKLKFIDGTDLVIMGTFTKKATLCEILPAKEVEAALQKRH